ncbi:hypothetical protein [Actinoplanes sp. NPDC051851]|uniref:hypothetical protein n=1 Tax=Actinoplanes sp. NPDC051851 TaxID=3154753 RepID=UPI003430E104
MEPLSPWWREVGAATELLASTLNEAVFRAARNGSYAPPAGTPEPRRRRKAASLRHLAEVIRAHRLAPGISVDKDAVGAVLAGRLPQIADRRLVVAVARAAHLISGTPFGEADARRLAVACARVTAAVAAAREADRRAPSLLPARFPRAAGPSTRPGWRSRRLPVGVLVVFIVLAGVVLVARPPSTRAGSTAFSGTDPASPVVTSPAQACVPMGTPLPEGEVILDSTGRSVTGGWRGGSDGVVLTPNGPTMDAVVKGGTGGLWGRVITWDGLPLVRGRSYLLILELFSDYPMTIGVAVRDDSPPYRAPLAREIRLTPAACQRYFEFTSDLTIPRGQIALEVGGAVRDSHLWLIQATLIALTA